MEIKKINPLDLAILVAIFEFFALLIVGLIGVDNTVAGNLPTKIVAGFIVGFVCAFPALLLFNYTKMRLRVNNLSITGINIIPFAVANGIFIAIMFLLESIIVNIKSINIILGNMIVGFLTNFVILLVLLFIYNNQKFKLHLYMIRWVKIDRISVFSAALFVALTELIILPIMAVLMLLWTNPLWYAVVGFGSGFVGVYCAASLYNDFIWKKAPIVLKL